MIFKNKELSKGINSCNGAIILHSFRKTYRFYGVAVLPSMDFIVSDCIVPRKRNVGPALHAHSQNDLVN